MIAKSLIQMTRLHDEPAAQSVLVQSLARRTREKGIEGDYTRGATEIYEAKIIPALGRQIALMSDLKAHAAPRCRRLEIAGRPSLLRSLGHVRNDDQPEPRDDSPRPGSRLSLSIRRGSMRS